MKHILLNPQSQKAEDTNESLCNYEWREFGHHLSKSYILTWKHNVIQEGDKREIDFD